MMKRALVLSLLLSFFAIAIPTPSHACSVAAGWPPSGLELMAHSDAVFIGTVKSIIQDRSAMGEFRVTFTVEESFKGDLDKTIILRIASSSAACGYDDGYEKFKEGSIWTIFATGSQKEGYATNSIGLNESFRTVRAAREALADMRITNDPIACTMEYRPVCGTDTNGKERTYGNMCSLGAERGTFKHEGQCGPEGSVPSQDLTLGSRGSAVTWLQEFLIARAGGSAAQALEAAGATGYFGVLTRAALAEFQTLVSITPSQGYFGAITRAYLSATR